VLAEVGAEGAVERGRHLQEVRKGTGMLGYKVFAGASTSTATAPKPRRNRQGSFWIPGMAGRGDAFNPAEMLLASMAA